jgi:formate dehydrogenase accessory protein FdhE
MKFRGGPGNFGARLVRVRQLLGEAEAVAGPPLAVLEAVLAHQEQRTPPLAEQQVGSFPALDLLTAVAPIASEIAVAVGALAGTAAMPVPLAEAGRGLGDASDEDRRATVEEWLADGAAVDPRTAFWVRVAAGPVLAPAAAAIEPPGKEQWAESICPACGGRPQLSVIAPETGEFMAGSPRLLVCGRCASWWFFPRATCPWCGEDDPRRLVPYVADGRRYVRIDSCETCGSYVKTFDLREPGAKDVVPLVDDVATLALDVWAHQQRLVRPVVSLAGV